MKKSLLITITLVASLILGFAGCANKSDANAMRDITEKDFAVIKSWNSVKFCLECHTDREIEAGVPTQVMENDSYYDILSTEDDGDVQYYINYTTQDDSSGTVTYSDFVGMITRSSSKIVQINNDRTKIVTITP